LWRLKAYTAAATVLVDELEAADWTFANSLQPRVTPHRENASRAFGSRLP
jgi:hypothetical protein